MNQPASQQPEPEYGEGDPAILDEVIEATEAERGFEGISPIVRAEIDIQIATAKRYPRSIRKFQQEAKGMACLNEETAAACIYSLPRAGKALQGPSVRLAEIVASCWSNLRLRAGVVEEGEKFLTAQGFCHDLERNVAATVDVRRRITTKQGKRFGDDMIVVAGNAAASIAFRNAVFRVVPKAYWDNVFEAVRQTALGKAETLSAKRQKAVDYWTKAGVSVEQILAVLDRKSLEDVGLEDLLHLRGIFTSIKEGTTTIEEAFKPRETAPTTAPPRQPLRKPVGNGNTPPPSPTPTPTPAPTPTATAQAPAGDSLAEGEVPNEDGSQRGTSDDIERDDMILRVKEQVEAAASAEDLVQVEAEFSKHRDFLGNDHFVALKQVVKERGAALTAAAARPARRRVGS